MAQKVEVLLVCDLHDDDVEGAETVTFGLDGSGYEIDVCAEHAAGLRDALAPYVGAGRRAGRSAPAQRTGRSGARSSNGAGAGAAKERTQDIREWARAHGHQVNERGRLPGAVIAAYDQAH
ncbi:MAG TPA: Lsr2 family protein [Mycobacteriales bacterium]|nr:Lsr2 family protein [Mycobacteriales bacterium]